MTDIPRVLGGRYEVGELIGRGGMAQVHLGYDTRLSRTVAIKILRTDLAQDPMFLARFRREAQSAAALNHPSIVSVYDTGEEQLTSAAGRPVSLPYIIMEYVKGRTVSALLSGGDPVPIGEAVQITVGVLNALEYSHHEGIIHRDIKPGNVMLTPEGKVKVMDFGIARAIADSAATMTQTNSVVGTAQYLSPEQARGEVVDTRSDLYSTGCLLYELLTGKPPFTGDSAVAVAYQHVSEAPRPASLVAPDVPDAIDRVVMKSLAKQRDERYQSAADFRNDLLSAARGEGVAAPSVTSWNIKPVAPAFPPTMVATAVPGVATNVGPATTATGISADDEKKTKKRNRIMIIVGVVILLLAAAGIIWAVNSDQNNVEPTPTATTQANVSVPDLTGLNESQARQSLESEGLVFSNGGTQASTSVDKGLFVASNPEAGTQVAEGYTVIVYFSSGPDSVEVPSITGVTVEQATKLLAASGLVVGRSETVNDPSESKDRIVSQDPAEGTSVAPGTSVNITIASGNVVVPRVTNMSLDAARTALTEAGLVVDDTIQYEDSSTVSAGTVIAQTIGENTVVAAGSRVGLVVAQAASTPSESPTSPASPTSSPTTQSSDEDPQG